MNLDEIDKKIRDDAHALWRTDLIQKNVDLSETHRQKLNGAKGNQIQSFDPSV